MFQKEINQLLTVLSSLIWVRSMLRTSATTEARVLLQYNKKTIGIKD